MTYIITIFGINFTKNLNFRDKSELQMVELMKNEVTIGMMI